MVRYPIRLKNVKSLKIRKKRIDHEGLIQEKMVVYLRRLEKLKKLTFFHVPNENAIKMPKLVRLKRWRMGLRPGVWDLLIIYRRLQVIEKNIDGSYFSKIYPADYLWIEVKYDSLKTKNADPEKLLTDDQKDFREKLRFFNADHEVLCAKNTIDGIRKLEEILKQRGEKNDKR